MAATVTSALNLNNLAAPQYRLVFQKIPNVVFRCQMVNLPGISITAIDQPSPTHLIPVPGDGAEYDPLDITFIVDEDLSNWIEISNWIVGLCFPKSTDQYKALLESNTIRSKFGGIYSDATLISLTNSSLANKQVIFRDCFPIALSSIDFDSTGTDNGVITGVSSFRYTYYTIESL